MGSNIMQGDCRVVLPTLESDSVQCVVTSPPYFGLRDYGVDGQLGLESTPAEFVEQLVSVFREVRRVLRADGTLWLNLGDSYGGVRGNLTSAPDNMHKHVAADTPTQAKRGTDRKQLLGMPWRVAFALQADGWYLRQDIIWHKPNTMPESVSDRCTKAHEYLFLLTKSARYYFDAKAIEEPVTQSTIARISQPSLDSQHGSDRVPGKTNGPMKAVVKRSGNVERKPSSARGCPDGSTSNVCGSVPWEGTTRNKRSVWTVTTQPFKGAHFATFPPKLIEPCVLAGSAPGDLVLDPFNGAGTTGLVASRLGRRYIGIELNPEYAAMSESRIRNDAPLLNGAV